MALVSVNPLDEVKATDINQFKDALEGAVAGTVPFFLRTATGEDFIIRLGGNAASRKLSVQDSDAAEVFKVDADGNLTAAGSFSPGTLILPSSTTPTPTVEGDIKWDSNDNHLVIGDGSGQVNIGPVASVLTTTGDILYASSAATLARLAASTDGYVLTATGAGSAPAWEALPPSGPTRVIKTADQVVTNSIVVVNDTHLSFPVAASSFYWVKIYLNYIVWPSYTAGGLRMTFTDPASTMWNFSQTIAFPTSYYAYGWGNAEPSYSETAQIISISSGGTMEMIYEGFVRTAGTSGTMQFQWAQSGAGGGSKPSTLKANSYIDYELSTSY